MQIHLFYVPRWLHQATGFVMLASECCCRRKTESKPGTVRYVLRYIGREGAAVHTQSDGHEKGLFIYARPVLIYGVKAKVVCMISVPCDRAQKTYLGMYFAWRKIPEMGSKA